MSGRLSFRAQKDEVVQSKSLSFARSFLTYLGPALIVSVAYMDPGNYGTDLVAGGSFRYALVWAVWLASGMAMILQYLSGKLGIATGKSLPELVRHSLHRSPLVVSYWLGAEIAAAATDLAEYLGTVIALNLLFGVPMLYAAIFGAADVILIMALATRKFRMVEQFFIVLVSIIGFGFLYEAIVIKPDLQQIAFNSLLPSLPGADITYATLLVVGIIGATVMPHALFVHSWLSKNKVNDGSSIEERRRVRKLHLTETTILLGIAGVINVAILVVSASLYPESNLTIQLTYMKLIEKFGYAVAVVFVLTLFASGLSSSTTGTLAGQVIMEGLLGKSVKPWLRRIVTRFVNVFPTTIAIFLGLNPLSLLVYSQVGLSLLIPLPMVPLIYYTSKRKFMGDLLNHRATTVIAIVAAGIIVVFNGYLILNILSSLN